MTDLTKLSERKLVELMDKLRDASSAATKALIAAGYGNEFCSETRKRAAETNCPLAVAYVKAADAEQAAWAEERSRLRYQGNRKPIRRAA